MALLAGTNYDPGTAASKSTASLLAMTALDTTNLRLSFTVPSNGSVLVRQRCTLSGATTFPQILLGVMNGASVVARQAPLGAINGTAVATSNVPQEALFTVSGLTPGANLTWDAAYAVQVVAASSAIEYGGPNDTTANNAWGGFQYEIWEAPNLLGSILYDPGTAVSKSGAAALAMTALDTTNLRLTFTAPSSGNVLVRLRGTMSGSTSFAQILFGILESATVLARTTPIGGLKGGSGVSSTNATFEGQSVVTGVSAGSHTWDAAWAVETAGNNLKYGGPNDTTGNDAWGGFLYELWSV